MCAQWETIHFTPSCPIQTAVEGAAEVCVPLEVVQEKHHLSRLRELGTTHSRKTQDEVKYSREEIEDEPPFGLFSTARLRVAAR